MVTFLSLTLHSSFLSSVLIIIHRHILRNPLPDLKPRAQRRLPLLNHILQLLIQPLHGDIFLRLVFLLLLSPFLRFDRYWTLRCCSSYR